MQRNKKETWQSFNSCHDLAKRIHCVQFTLFYRNTKIILQANKQELCFRNIIENMMIGSSKHVEYIMSKHFM
jgi:hypothetical protein